MPLLQMLTGFQEFKRTSEKKQLRTTYHLKSFFLLPIEVPGEQQNRREKKMEREEMVRVKP